MTTFSNARNKRIHPDDAGLAARGRGRGGWHIVLEIFPSRELLLQSVQILLRDKLGVGEVGRRTTCPGSLTRGFFSGSEPFGRSLREEEANPSDLQLRWGFGLRLGLRGVRGWDGRTPPSPSPNLPPPAWPAYGSPPSILQMPW